MITMLTGAPGTGKSAAIVKLLSELHQGRTIYCHGIPELQVPHQELVDPKDWINVVPDGCIVVIDEVQSIWRPRGPGQKVPPEIAALETHRHRGIDFYILTQGPNLTDSNIRGLVGRHIHLRDLGILGRWWYEWPECADNCRTAWKNAPIKKRYSLPKAIFDKYKSASVHVKPIRSIPWMLAVMVVALVVVGFMTWKAYSAIRGKMSPAVSVSTVAKPVGLDGVLERRGAAAGVALEPPVLFDASEFVPRLPARPETAPAFDHLRLVVVMPQVAGGMCTSRRCVCVTQQGTPAGLSDRECRDWLENRPFNPYQGFVSDVVAPISAGVGTVSAGKPSP